MGNIRRWRETAHHDNKRGSPRLRGAIVLYPWGWSAGGWADPSLRTSCRIGEHMEEGRMVACTLRLGDAERARKFRARYQALKLRG